MAFKKRVRLGMALTEHPNLQIYRLYVMKYHSFKGHDKGTTWRMVMFESHLN